MSAPPSAEPGLTVAGLAHTWAAVASQTTYLPMSGDETERLLTRLINRLVTAVAAAPVDEQAAIEVAAELVAHDLTGSSSIGRSIEILGAGLPRLAQLQHVGGRDTAILRLLGALASGYAQALRQRTLDQQDQLMQALVRANLFQKIFSESVVGIAVSDLAGTMVAVNRAFGRMVGRAPENLIGAALPEVLHSADDPTLAQTYHELSRGTLTHFRCPGQLTAASGEVSWVFLAGFLLRDPEGVPTHHAITAEDITELHLLQQVLSEQVLHDMLTGLPNEHYFMSHLKDVLESADPSTMVTVCRVNLDNFSVINDRIGRSGGELVLRSVAARLQRLISGRPAMVARMGADDFAILIENGVSSGDLGMLATTVNLRLWEPIYLDSQGDDRGIVVSAGIGMVHRHAAGISAGELVRAADITLHRAKRIGRGQWDLYDPEYDAQQQERYQLATEIPRAWERSEIDVWYQPVCRLADGEIVALQAVLRWARADGTVLDQSECLALVEQTGLVVVLGRWIVQKACRRHLDVLHHWPQSAPLLRVDLTAQLSQDPDLIAVVREALSATGLRAEQLQLGVPLAVLAHGHGDVLDNVGTVAELGIEVVLTGALADHGYLTYLEDLRVGAVEIAPEIVVRIARRPGDDSVVAQAVRQAIPLVHRAGATVIVPGVDTAEQAQWWQGAGADTARGSHLGPPAPGTQLLRPLPHG